MQRVLFFLFVFASFSLRAQQSIGESGASLLYARAQEAYQQGSYFSAGELFRQYVDSPDGNEMEAKYYLAICKLHNGDATGLPEVKRFVSAEPNHPLTGGANYVIGNHFFNNKEYNRAASYYRQVERVQLSVKDQEELLFKSGYAYLNMSEQEKAKESFAQVVDFHGKYFEDASYYLGLIRFQTQEYAEALAVLDPIDKENSKYSSQVALLVASCYFETKVYARLYAYAEPKLKAASSDDQKELNRLIGEAYYSQNKFDRATPYLQKYVDKSKRTSADTYYKLAFCYFKAGENQLAIEHFKLSGLEKGELGQLSSFYLGQLYMKVNNLNYAYSAFKKVTETKANPEMVEESYVTLAKINYQRGQYAESVADFNAFLAKYPNSRWKLEVNELLAQSYLKSSNYDQALAHLENIPNKSTSLKKAYQKVSFQKGQLLYNDSKFSQAATYFDQASLFAMDREITAQAYYLKGECLSINNEYDQAKQSYKNAMEQGIDEWVNKSRYGLGYISYNQKDYRNAEIYFRDFIQNSFKRDELTIDARLRLADCYYVQKDYDRAVKQYQEVTQPEYASYIGYQMGLIYRLQEDKTKALAAFDQVINDPRSSYADNAFFQKGKLYVSDGEFQSAVKAYKSLITGFPESNLVPFAKTDLALCYLNLNQVEEAKKTYQDVLDNYMSHEVANDALLGLQEVIKKGEKVKGFEDYMERFQEANPDNESLEVVAFEDAKASYYNQQYEEAIRKLSQFNTKYPNSGYSLDALYFLGDSYSRIEQWTKAVEQFKNVIDQGSSAYLIRSLDKRGKAYLAIRDYASAIANYLILSKKAVSRKELYLAQEGLLEAYYAKSHLDSALYYADAILNGDWKSGNVETDTWLIKGKIFFRKKSYSAALDEFIKVANEVQNENGAEAKFMIGKVYYEQQQHKRSLEVLFDLNKNFGSYPYWIGKSFLLIADNYLKMGELLQAEATTKSIIENATIPEIVSEAKEKMLVIQKKEDEVIIPKVEEDTVNK